MHQERQKSVTKLFWGPVHSLKWIEVAQGNYPIVGLDQSVTFVKITTQTNIFFKIFICANKCGLRWSRATIGRCFAGSLQQLTLDL